MSLDLELRCNCNKPCCKKDLFHHNITHNLGAMFQEAGVYRILWHGNGLRAGDVLGELTQALVTMEKNPDRFKKFDDPKGRGTYPQALEFLNKVVFACAKHPDGIIYCSI